MGATGRGILLACLLAVVGCAGPKALRHSRQQYNEAIQTTSAEQLLLNLIRLRYRDRPSFMELTSLSTQFAFEERNSVGFGFPGDGPTSVSLGATLSGSERPTVTYDPLQGGEFVERLISPLKEETIILLIRSGWSIERVLRMTVQELNGIENARRASGPTPDTISWQEYGEFQHLVQALRGLQIDNKIRIGYDESAKQLSGSIPASQLTAEAFVSAAREGWKLQPKHERVTIKVEKIATSSDVTADYLDRTLFANLVATVKHSGVPQPIRVMARGDWMKHHEERKPSTRLFDRVAALGYGPKMPEELPPPHQTSESEARSFVAVEGERSDLLLAACWAAGIERVPCIVEIPDRFMLSGTSQSLVLNWDAEALAAPSELLDLGLPGLENVEEEKYTLSLEPRSLVGILYYLSHAIRIPPAHESCGLVNLTTNEMGEIFDWASLTGDLLLVGWSRERPKCAAVAVKYRDYWFYIDDRDQRSKATFTLLSGLFELQAGGGATGTKPVLTLPVGI